jgi:hypothetical protein
VTIAGSFSEEIDFQVFAEGHGGWLSEKGGGGVKIPAGIKTPAGITRAKYRRDSLHQDTGGNHKDTGGNHDGHAGLDAIPTGMPAESRRFCVHRVQMPVGVCFNKFGKFSQHL